MFITPAFAQAAGTPATGDLFTMLVPMALIMVVVRPDRVPSWTAVGVAFLVLLWVAIRFPRAQQRRD